MRDLVKDLELCEKLAIGNYPNQTVDEFILMEFFHVAQDGWPEAIQRALEAEALIEKMKPVVKVAFEIYRFVYVFGDTSPLPRKEELRKALKELEAHMGSSAVWAMLRGKMKGAE